MHSTHALGRRSQVVPNHTHHSQQNVATSPVTSDDNVLEVRDLTVTMNLRQGMIRPVDGVTLSLKRGEILGLVGESGCGKTTVALAVAALLPRFATITGGQILLNGQNLAALRRSEMRTVRGAKIGTVFQDPMSSLDPCFRVGDQITEAIRAHGSVSRADAVAKAVAMLETVGMPDPTRQMRAYPHELSGGMRQRVGLAIALIADPIVLVADEPTTALDVTLQRQILQLLKHLRREFGFSAIFITHDLAVVDEVADRIAVMYCGQIVESGPVQDVLQDPRHPYTQGLLRSMPGLAMPGHNVPVIGGEVPDMLKLPGGCRFQPRCPNRIGQCAESVPQLVPSGGDRELRCYNPTPLPSVVA
jgi:oligopeptide/dipeptide ABC transporter ATP-binding protein